MAGPTELSQVFAGVLTPTQLAARRQMRDMAMNQQYGSDEARPWRAELARSLDTLAENTPGTQQYKDIQTAKANQDVLNNATKKYQSHLDDGQSVDDAQLSVINDAMRSFSASGNYDAIAALAPSYLALQQKGAEIAKLRQETTRSAAAQRKDEVSTVLEPVKTNDALLNSVSLRDLRKAQTDKAREEASKVPTSNIVDLVNPKQGEVTASIDPRTGTATYTDPVSGEVTIRKPGQYLDKTKEKGGKSGSGSSVADSMQPAMLASVKLDIKEVRSGLSSMGSLTTDKTGPFFNDERGQNALTALFHRGATPEANQRYEVQANRMAVAIASMQSMGRGQISDAKVREARKLVPQPGDKKGTIKDKLAKISQIADQAEETLYQARTDGSAASVPSSDGWSVKRVP